MRSTICRLVAAIAVALVAVSAAHAIASGLANTPTADILTPGEFCTSLGATLVQDEEADITLYSQFGVATWLEAGYDYSFTAEQGVGNVKVGMPVQSGAVAAGVQNVNDDEEWYGVYTYSPERIAPFRLHVGALDSSVSDITPFLSCDYAYTDNLTLMLEGAGGDEPFGAVGAAFPLVKGLDALVSGIFGLPGGVQVYTEVGCSFPF